MTDMDITTAAISDMTNRVEDITVDALDVEGVFDQKETSYMNSDWPQYWGYFNALPELKSAILMKAIWNVGKGWKSKSSATTAILDSMTGWGVDTFDDILFNMEVIRRINGDSFAEIIRNEKGTLINLKPLDPGKIKIVVNRMGIIKRYEQINKTSDGKTSVKRFEPDEMFHLSNNRLADQIHGISDIKSMEKTILAENESFDDAKWIMHHQARPIILFKLGTDNETEIAQFTAKMDKAVNKGENIYVPNDKTAFDFEVIQVNPSQVAMEWRNQIKNKFYRILGLPQIIFGSAGTTESGGKIEYAAYEQVFERDQRYLEKQIWAQLELEIDLIPPISLLNNLQTDEAKDKDQGLEFQPADVIAGRGE